MTGLQSTAALILLMALTACATSAQRSDQPRAVRTASVGTDCLPISLASDFRFLDERNLIVYAPRNQPYHLELSPGCFGLPARSRIALRARSDRLCGFGGDAVEVNGSFAERCPVLSVRRLDENEFQALIDSFEPPAGQIGSFEVEIPAAED